MEDVFGPSLTAQTSLKVKVNFGGLCAVYVWKNIFTLVVVVVECIYKPNVFSHSVATSSAECN